MSSNSKFRIYSDSDRKNEIKLNTEPLDCPRCNMIPDRVYIEIIIPNQRSDGSQAPVPATFQPTQFSTIPLLDDPSKWNIIPLRFSVPSQLIPTTIIPATGATGSFGVCLSYTGLNFPSSVQNLGGLVSDQSGLFPNTYVWNYNDIAESFNLAFVNSYNNMVAACPTFNTGTDPFPPFFSYNPQTQLYSINATPGFYSPITGSCQIWWNNNAFNNFQSFPGSVSTYNNDPNYKNFTPYIRPYGGTPASNNVQLIIPRYPYSQTYPNGITGISQQQAFNCLENWNVFKSIAVTTQQVPVAPINYNNQNGSAPTRQNVLTDFDIASTIGSDAHGYINYAALSEYRRVNMFGDQPLYYFDHTFNWVDKYQNFTPIPIPYLDSVESLWMLERKSLTRSDSHYCCERTKT